MPVSPGVGGRESVSDGRVAAGAVRGSGVGAGAGAGVGVGAVRGAAGAAGAAGVGVGLLDSTAADLRAILRAAFLAGGVSLMTGAAVGTTAGAAALRVDFFGAAGVGGAGGGAALTATAFGARVVAVLVALVFLAAAFLAARFLGAGASVDSNESLMRMGWGRKEG